MLLAFRAALRAAIPLAIAATLGAQEGGRAVVAGRVIDGATRTPVSAATVRLVEVHREVRSHEDGSFTFGLVAAGQYQLTVHRLGYGSVTRTLVVTESAAVTVEVVLFTSPLQLNATVVTGQLSERRAADAISPTNVLSDAKLDRRLDGTLGSTIAGTPGISVASMGPATARPVVRGLSGDRVLILEDGLRTGDLSSTSMDHAVATDPLTARRIEVVRGPMSLLYGSSALGGVVNLIRHEIPTSVVEHVHGTASVQATSVNAGGAVGGFAEFPLAGFAMRAEASGRRAGDQRTPVGRLGNTEVQSVGASIGVSKIAPWGYGGISYRHFGNEYGVPGGFVGAHPSGVDISMRRHMVRGEADWHPADGLFESVKSTVGFTDYLHDEIESSGSIATRFQQLMTAAEVVARNAAIGPFSGGAIGVRAQYRDITTEGALRTPSTADWSVAGFVVQEAGTGPLRLQAGVRYDLARFIPLEAAGVVVRDDTIPALPRRFGAFSGSLGALYRLENGVRIGANVSRAYRTPDFNELYSDGPHLAAYSYEVGDPRIGQETGLGVDLFARLERERFRGEVALFANRLDGFLYPRNTGELGRQGERWKFQFSNEDAMLLGAEGDVELTLRDHIVFDATVSYVRGTIRGPRETIPGLGGEPDVVESRFLPLIPPLNGRLGLRHETPQWSYGGGARWAARQSLLGDFESITDGYATLDLDVGRRFLRGSRLHGITLRVENLLDAEVRAHLSRTKEIIPEAGRNVSLLYRVQF